MKLVYNFSEILLYFILSYFENQLTLSGIQATVFFI